MYHALLVDDEISILQNLYDAVSWEDYGFEEVTLAHDGIEALSVLQCKSYDLLITDIKMPNMGGLELLRHVRTLYPNISCILLTAYGDFEYIKEALQLGVDNYLLKPLNIAELNASIEKTLEKHAKTQSSAINVICNDLFYRNLLYRWVTGDLIGHELTERANLSKLNIFCRNYCVILIRPLSDNPIYNDILTVIHRYLYNDYEVYYLSVHLDLSVFIVGGHMVNCHELQNNLQKITNSLSDDSDALTVIGPTVSSSNDLNLSYNAAENVIKCFKLFTTNPSNAILLADDICNLSSKNIKFDLDSILQDSSDKSAQKQIFDFADNILNICGSISETSSAHFNKLLYSIAYEIGKTFTFDMDIPSSLQYHFEKLKRTTSKSAFIECIYSLIMEVRSIIRPEIRSLSPIVKRALQYVDENFSEQISIKQFSENSGVNASYFGYLFKKEMGLYFFEHLNKVRIKHAEKFLLNTEQSISVISSKVGFTDNSYFYKCFKKENGISPAKYRIIYKS